MEEKFETLQDDVRNLIYYIQSSKGNGEKKFILEQLKAALARSEK